MATSLGILIASDRHFPHVLGLARAASKRGVAVRIFLTHKGVRLVKEPDLPELASLARIDLCRHSLEAEGLDPEAAAAVLGAEAISTQARHADLIYECDRYLVF
jgi:peroxiredoxin family protein